MALIPCTECKAKMSDAAEACPQCGNPNRKVKAKKKDSKQAIGCLLILVAIPLSFVLTPVVGLLLAVVGVVMLIVNTRLR